MTTATKVTEFSNLYNANAHLVEIISDESQIRLQIENIKADRNVNIEILQFVYKSDYYKILENKLKDIRQKLANTEDYQTRIELNRVLKTAEQEAKDYKMDILITAGTLYKVKDTDNITEVKKHFFAGNIKNAFEVINAAGLDDAQSTLLEILETQQKLNEVYEKLVDNANEYMIKAQLTTLNLEIEKPEDRFQKTIEFYENGKKSAERSKKQEFIAEYVFKYAEFLLRTNQFNQADSLFQQALTIYETLSITKPNVFKKHVAKIFITLGLINVNKNELHTAESFYQKSLEIIEQLDNNESDNYELAIAVNLANLGMLFKRKNEFISAEKHYQKALDIIEKKNQINPIDYEPVLAWLLNNYGEMQRSCNNFKQAEIIFNKALIIRERLSINNPDVHLPQIAMLNNNLANVYFFKNELESAELRYKKAIEIVDQLSKANPEIFNSDKAKYLTNLAILCETKNNFQLAENYLIKAIELIKPYCDINPEFFEPELAFTLKKLSKLYVNDHNYQLAETTLQKELDILERYSKLNPAFYEPYLADTLDRLANLYLTINENQENSFQFLTLDENNMFINCEIIPEYSNYEQVEILLKKALEINERFALNTPETFEPILARTLINCSLFYYQTKKYQQTIYFTSRAENICNKYITLPNMQEYLFILQKIKFQLFISNKSNSSEELIIHESIIENKEQTNQYIADSYFNDAENYFNQNLYEDAIEAFTESINFSAQLPFSANQDYLNYAKAIMRRGICYSKRNKENQNITILPALEDFITALSVFNELLISENKIIEFYLECSFYYMQEYAKQAYTGFLGRLTSKSNIKMIQSIYNQAKEKSSQYQLDTTAQEWLNKMETIYRKYYK